LILMILVSWYLGLYGHGRYMEAHPGSRSNLGIIVGPALFFLGYISLFLLWSMILAVYDESIKPLSLKIQLVFIFLLAVVPSVFVLWASFPGIKDAFRKYESLETSPSTPSFPANTAWPGARSRRGWRWCRRSTLRAARIASCPAIRRRRAVRWRRTNR